MMKGSGRYGHAWRIVVGLYGGNERVVEGRYECLMDEKQCAQPSVQSVQGL